MTRFILAALMGLASFAASAELWQFDGAVDVTAYSNGANSKFFHHLDSSGRRNIATTGDTVAIVWEDDRDGTPRVYLAHKARTAKAFDTDIRISSDGEAYEPSIIALDDMHYVIAWEEDGQVLARSVALGAKLTLGEPRQLSETSGAQVNLAVAQSGIVATWSERDGRYGRIRTLSMTIDEAGTLQPGEACFVDPAPATDEQLYPAAAIAGDALVVAWEDRRPKHTIVMAAAAPKSRRCEFSPPVRISEKPDARNLPYGTGHGVSRVALGRFGANGLFAAWADKRSFRDGYDIWGADYLLDKGGFGSNEKVQDDFSDLSKQRFATVGGNPDGMLVVAWSDEREGNADVMLSWREDGEWSDDWPLPGANGEGHQSNPSIAIDNEGNVHAAWIERKDQSGTTRLKYAFGAYSGE